MHKFPILFFLFLCFSCQEKQPDLWEEFPTIETVEELAKLPKSIKESSGLVYWQQGLWTLNDSGDGAYLYEVGTYKKAQNRIALLGYNQSSKGHRPFIWTFSNFQGNDFFTGAAKRVNLPLFLQTEGICHFQGDQFLLTNESGGGAKGRVHLWEMQGK